VAWLILGVVLWSGVHLFPAVGTTARAAWIERLGEGPYKGLFALSLVVAIVLMVLGWRSTAPVAVYAPPLVNGTVPNLLMFAALLLFLASGVPTNIKRFLRHPQLTGFAAWAATHLLANGEARSLVLFGGLGVWAIVEIVCLNRRDGAWRKPEPLPLAADLKPLVAAIIGFAVFYFAHPWLAGVSLASG
jgi:uncharacterized membrane protein